MKHIRLDGVVADVSSWSRIHWVAVLLFVGNGVINIYLGYVEGQTPLLVIGGSFLLGVALFASRFWDPVLYLFVVLHVGVLAVVWILDRMPFFAFGVVTGCFSVGLAAISMYLLVEEESTVGR